MTDGYGGRGRYEKTGVVDAADRWLSCGMVGLGTVGGVSCEKMGR